MKRESAVYCLVLWAYLTVFVLMEKPPKCAGSQMTKKNYGIHTITFREPSVLLENGHQKEGNLQTQDFHTVESAGHTKNETTATDQTNGSPGSSQDLFTPEEISVNLLLASSNSCQQISDTVYLSEENKITIFFRTISVEQSAFKWNKNLTIHNSTFKKALSNADDLNVIMTETEEFHQTSKIPREISNLVTVNFLINTRESELRDESDQDYVIFRCNFTIKDTTVVTKILPPDKTFWSRKKPRNVSLTFRFLESYDSGEFNIRSIVEDIDKFMEPSYCSSKIPFFYSLVISGELKSNSLYIIFISFNYILSACSLFLIFLTAKLSHQWRQRKSNIILINFTIAIFSQIILHFVSDFSEVDERICATVTILCHYFTLVQFFWTSIIAYMQYRRYVQVFDEKDSYFLIKLILFAWLTPVLVIFASLILVFSIHRNSTTCVDKFKTCSLINTYLLKYSVSLPLLFTLLINFIFFILIFRHLIRRKPEIDQRTSALVEVKLAFVLFFLLDLNLIVAIIADMFSIDILALIFVTSHSLQGVLLFVVFVVRNKCSRKMYIRWLNMLYNRVSLPI